MFWGSILKENKPYKTQSALEDNDYPVLHISNVALPRNAPQGKVHLLLSMGKGDKSGDVKELTIATLSKDKVESIALDLYVNVSQQVVLTLAGPAGSELHLSGFFEPQREGEDDDGMFLEEGDEEDEDEEEEVAGPTSKKLNKSLTEAKQNALKNSVAPAGDDEDDEDDEDDYDDEDLEDDDEEEEDEESEEEAKPVAKKPVVATPAAPIKKETPAPTPAAAPASAEKKPVAAPAPAAAKKPVAKEESEDDDEDEEDYDDEDDDDKLADDDDDEDDDDEEQLSLEAMLKQKTLQHKASPAPQQLQPPQKRPNTGAPQQQQGGKPQQPQGGKPQHQQQQHGGKPQHQHQQNKGGNQHHQHGGKPHHHGGKPQHGKRH